MTNRKSPLVISNKQIPISIYVAAFGDSTPSAGGWAAIFEQGRRHHKIAGGARATTYSRMHLTGVVEALETLRESHRVTVYCPNRYVMAGVVELSDWKKRQWRDVYKRPIKNEDLWRRLYKQDRKHEISWRW